MLAHCVTGQNVASDVNFVGFFNEVTTTEEEWIVAASDVGANHANAIPTFEVRDVRAKDIVDAIKLGVEDFNAKPSHLLLLGLIYPIAGALGAAWAFGADMIPLILPIVGGYALLGPFVAVVLYRVSRRREQGRDFPWSDAFTKITGPNGKTIAILGLFLVAVFIIWLLIAQAIYNATIGSIGFSTAEEFLRLVFTTQEGWTLILLGNGIGFLLAVFVLATNVISFPMALDLEVGPLVAIKTSMRAAFSNPQAMLLWGLIIVSSMMVGAMLLLVGLAVVLPVLGHASWHVYRKVIAH